MIHLSEAWPDYRYVNCILHTQKVCQPTGHQSSTIYQSHPRKTVFPSFCKAMRIPSKVGHKSAASFQLKFGTFQFTS